MPLVEERESRVVEYFIKSFEEKSPLDYDILDSMSPESNKTNLQISKNQ